MSSFVEALKARDTIAFKKRFSGIDVLMIDDMQFLTGRTVQQEFCHMLNALLDSARQIVVAADRPPAGLEGVDERVRSRLKGGVVVGLSAPDLASPGLIFQIGVPPIRVDVITSIDGVVFEDAWSERVASEYGGVPVNVLSRRHLIQNKKAAGRLQDLADVEFLEGLD